ncbi:DUF397 domain-containing protein [Kitasatospora sp. NPDC101801]|uniref:DUF397 domain-containing protein n=1 Tax=Kitasatospora sp. NPDC101801 TaxID=3364103 RepID=UPI00380A8891
MHANGVPASSIVAHWIKSFASSANGNCAELAKLADGTVALRNSRDPEGPALIFSRPEMEAFITGAKNNEFDHLVA